MTFDLAKQSIGFTRNVPLSKNKNKQTAF